MFYSLSGPAQTVIPDGPFNPTNYSGTQINVWGAPPGSIWPGMNAQPGMVAFGSGPPFPQYPVQYGFLTEQMIQVISKEIVLVNSLLHKIYFIITLNYF